MSRDAARLAHWMFVVTLLGKGLLGVTQVLAAVAILAGMARYVPGVARWFFGEHLAQHPDNFIASHAIALADSLPSAETGFYAAYFLLHGLLHLGVVVALLAGVLWAYPAAIALLGGFIALQMAEWLHVGGPLLLVLSALDLFVIYLTVIEWQRRKPRVQTAQPLRNKE